MLERPRTHKTEAADETAERYLANLGLEWSELKGKKVLDIGANTGEFENAARRQGVEVVSADQWLSAGDMPPIDSRFVVARATKLPFQDESFNYIVAHMSVMNYIEKSYEEKDGYLVYIEDILKESFRILKPDGQFHFTDTVFEETDLRQDKNEVIPDRLSNKYNEWRTESEARLLKEIAESVGFRKLELRVHSHAGHPRPEGDEHILHYYIAFK